MDPRKPAVSPGVRIATSDLNSRPGLGGSPGIANLYTLNGSSILVNISAASAFGYSTLFRITALALRAGGMLEACNEDIAIYAFPREGINEFIEGLGAYLPMVRTVVSPREKGISKVNIRFLGS